MGKLADYLDKDSALNDSDADGANSSEDRAATARGENFALTRERFRELEPDKEKADKQYDEYYRKRGH